MPGGGVTPFREDDPCLSLFGSVWATGVVDWPQGAHVLEIGCAESDWMTPMLALRPDLQITGIDWQDPGTRPGAVVRGDVLTVDWPDGTFDAAVGVSSIEHIGLGHYDHDPVDADGDTRCMERVARWLKPGGVLYADVPYGRGFKVDRTSHRVYDDAALASRLMVSGLRERCRWYGSDYARELRSTPEWNARGLLYVALLATKEC